MAKRPGANLQVITETPASNAQMPPGKLGASGMSLWQDIVSSYEFSDRASYQILFEACAMADRVAELRDLIDRDGAVIRTKTGVRENPLLKAELGGRSFIVRTLARLGLDLEPLRPGPGRPPGSMSIA